MRFFILVFILFVGTVPVGGFANQFDPEPATDELDLTNKPPKTCKANGLSLGFFNHQNHSPCHSGFMLGIFSNESDHKMTGVQFSFGINLVGSDFSGFQFAFLSSTTLNKFKGMQFSGLFNYAGSGSIGVQLSGLINYAHSDFNGLQLGLLFNYAHHRSKVVQVGILNMAPDAKNGFQVGLVNIGWVKVDGKKVNKNVNSRIATIKFFLRNFFMQTGIVNLAAGIVASQSGFLNIGLGDVRGQVGFFNYANNSRGSKIGFMNISKKCQGLSLGYLNVCFSDGGIGSDNWVSFSPNGYSFKTAIKFRHTYIYSGFIYSGANYMKESGDLITNFNAKTGSPGLYLGVHLPLFKKTIYLEGDVRGVAEVVETRLFDVSETCLNQGNCKDYFHRKYDGHLKTHLRLGYRPFSFLSLTAGIGYNFKLESRFYTLGLTIVPQIFQDKKDKPKQN